MDIICDETHLSNCKQNVLSDRKIKHFVWNPLPLNYGKQTEIKI